MLVIIIIETLEEIEPKYFEQHYVNKDERMIIFAKEKIPHYIPWLYCGYYEFIGLDTIPPNKQVLLLDEVIKHNRVCFMAFTFKYPSTSLAS